MNSLNSVNNSNIARFVLNKYNIQRILYLSEMFSIFPMCLKRETILKWLPKMLKWVKKNSLTIYSKRSVVYLLFFWFLCWRTHACIFLIPFYFLCCLLRIYSKYFFLLKEYLNDSILIFKIPFTFAAHYVIKSEQIELSFFFQNR